MEQNELIGKFVVNLTGKKGKIIDFDDDGNYVIQFHDKQSLYESNAFEKGFLNFFDKNIDEKYKADKAFENNLKESKNIKNCLKELDSLVGHKEIKDQIEDLICEINIFKLRKAYKLKVPDITRHMVFYGNPGTGKTTVARIVAKIYKILGVLSSGHLIEVDRSHLIAEYEGQTAIKTKNIVEDAVGGVLFIDEAYSICRGESDSYGIEALDTLTKQIEDHRDDLVVIVAGYKEEMKNFLSSNPGLNSRFKTFVRFEDFNSNELFKIFENMFAESDYKLDKKAIIKANKYFDSLNNLEGNGRTLRNMFEESIKRQSKRINGQNKVSKNDLLMIKEEDIDFCLNDKRIFN